MRAYPIRFLTPVYLVATCLSVACTPKNSASEAPSDDDPTEASDDEQPETNDGETTESVETPAEHEAGGAEPSEPPLDASLPPLPEVTDDGADSAPEPEPEPTDDASEEDPSEPDPTEPEEPTDDTPPEPTDAPTTDPEMEQPPPEGLVPMFVAIGRGGRRVVSCDDGQTWITDCQTDGGATARCQVEDNDGDHEAWASTGLASDRNGTFMALYGWFGTGEGAQILRSRNGVSWDNVFGGAGKPTGTFGSGIVFGNQTWAVNAQRSGTHHTKDNGDNWTSFSFSDEGLPHRRSLVFIPWEGGRFLSYGDNGRMTWSDDDSVTWNEGTTACPHLMRFAWGNGVLLAVAGEGTCHSTDGGETFTVREVPATRSNPVWTGSEFYIYESGQAARSPDAVNWEYTELSGNFGRAEGANDGGWPYHIARADSGTFVGIDGPGDAFHRSVDGVTWERRDEPSGTTITHLVFGYGEPSEQCPAP